MAVGRSEGKSSPAVLGAEGKALGGSRGGKSSREPLSSQGLEAGWGMGQPLFFGLCFGDFFLSFFPHPSTWTPHGLGPPSCLAPWLPHHHPASKMPAVPLPQGFS